MKEERKATIIAIDWNSSHVVQGNKHRTLKSTGQNITYE